MPIVSNVFTLHNQQVSLLVLALMTPKISRSFSSRDWFDQPSLEAAFRPVDQISQILPDVFISDCDFAYAPAELKRIGIKSILSLYQPSPVDLESARDLRKLAVVDYLQGTEESLHPKIVEAGVMKVAICLLNENERNSASELRRAVNLLAELKNTHPPVLVHCLAGKCRAPSVVATLIAREKGCTFEAAVTEVSKMRPIALTPAFVFGLLRANEVSLE